MEKVDSSESYRCREATGGASLAGRKHTTNKPRWPFRKARFQSKAKELAGQAGKRLRPSLIRVVHITGTAPP